ncbi:MAG: helix-hairpin-helix domain-containing protein [Phycisphaerae bacterium]|jgi:competence ComEA-like helix-hairpin-helix protein|nr:helix-hairpin-helix domain-containing protein [Phycisphaerae bacterium]
MRSFKMMLQISAVFLAIVICMNFSWKSERVKILIIDNFSSAESHGTSMKAIAQTWNRGKCEIIEFQTDESKLNYIRALLKATAHAAKNRGQKFVLNISMGSKGTSRFERAIHELLEYDNILVVAAAGNDGGILPLYPAALHGVTAIAASENGARASYSNCGRHVAFCVPVKKRKVFKRKLVDDGTRTVVVNSVIIKAGTSQASAKFSGLAALLWSARPDADKAEILKLAKSYCQPMDGPEYKAGLLGKGELSDFRVMLAHPPTWWTFLALLAESFVLCLILLVSPGMRKSPGARIAVAVIICVSGSFLLVYSDSPSLFTRGPFLVPLLFMAGLVLIRFSPDRGRQRYKPLLASGTILRNKRIILSSDLPCAKLTEKVTEFLRKCGAEVSLSSERTTTMPQGINICSHIFKSEDSSVDVNSLYFTTVAGIGELDELEFNVTGGSFGKPRTIATKLAELARQTHPFREDLPCVRIDPVTAPPTPIESMLAVRLAGTQVIPQERYSPAPSALQTPDDVAKVPDSSPQCVRIDPNTASLESILSIPGIGLTRAKAIIEYRQSHGPGAFETPEDLAKVPGIGPQTVRQIAGELSLPASDD